MEGIGICEHKIDCCVTGPLNVFPFIVQQMFFFVIEFFHCTSKMIPIYSRNINFDKLV